MMQTKKTQAIPVQASYIGAEDELDYKAICFYVATNLFLGSDTHFKGRKCLLPGREYQIENDKIVGESKWFDWDYNPRDISLQESVAEFGNLFEKITNEQLGDKKVILPLSGGLDSRTQACALIGRDNVCSYSYEYPGGIKEAKMAGDVANAANHPFKRLEIPKGYLWNRIDEIGGLLSYEGDVTVARQAAFLDELPEFGEIFYLGHWGDVLFDDMGVEENMTESELVNVMMKKIIKKGGLELATSLWNAFGLQGDLKSELRGCVENYLNEIKITNNNAKVRAFKSLYWAPRWTSNALPLFSKKRPIALPYYDERMCRFITTVPEAFLAGRQIQIEYIKQKSVQVGKVPWQVYAPLNLFNYHKFDSLGYIPIRGWRKIKREVTQLLTTKKIIQRNWELQFLGDDNDKHLREWLFNNPKFSSFIPQEIVKDFYQKFTSDDQVNYAYPISVLLTLSVFAKHKL